MCLPVGCLKACVGLATVITLALGVISIACSATIGTNNLFISTVKETKLVVMYLLIVFGALLIILAITGIVGVCKKSSCCLAIYNIGIVIFFLVFMAVGIAAVQALLLVKWGVPLTQLLLLLTLAFHQQLLFHQLLFPYPLQYLLALSLRDKFPSHSFN